jgi:uncharacterized membrane protein YqiK
MAAVDASEAEAAAMAAAAEAEVTDEAGTEEAEAEATAAVEAADATNTSQRISSKQLQIIPSLVFFFLYLTQILAT